MSNQELTVPNFKAFPFAAAATSASSAIVISSTDLTTVADETVTARVSGDMIVITDAAGGTATVTQANVNVPNGVIT